MSTIVFRSIPINVYIMSTIYSDQIPIKATQSDSKRLKATQTTQSDSKQLKATKRDSNIYLISWARTSKGF